MNSTTSITKIRKVINSKGWRVRRRESNSGSVYLNCIQGYKRLVIRVSDHPQTNKHIHEKNKPALDFSPGSQDTLADLRRILDDATGNQAEGPIQVDPLRQ